MSTVDSVRAALQNVVDPCSIATGVPISLIDMGLVKRVDVDAGVVTVELIVTSPMCMQVGLIRGRVEEVVSQLPGIDRVVIDIDARAEWWPEMISPDAQARLRAVRSLPIVAAPVNKDQLAG